MKCDEGYVCEVCGGDVEQIVDSDLYLRYVLCEVPVDRLHLQRNATSCNPSLQFIVIGSFEGVTATALFQNEPRRGVLRDEERA